MANSSAPILRFQNVDKSFRGRSGVHHVLKRISFEIMPGEVVCLVGPSGSGKSTLLRTVNALESIDGGEIEVCGVAYHTTRLPLHEIRRKTAMIFQRFELFPHFTALQNVELAVSLELKKSTGAARKTALELLDRVGLREHATKYPKALSGGQQQRVAIARALAVHPQILLCDEPTSALDPELVYEVLDILAEIARQGMTMLIVTHELAFARQIASRCFFLDEGELVEAAPTQSFFREPKSPRLKNFISRLHG